MRRAAFFVTVALLLGGCTPKGAHLANIPRDTERPERVAIEPRFVAQSDALKSVRLERYNGCGAFMKDVRREAARIVGPYGLDGMNTFGGPVAIVNSASSADVNAPMMAPAAMPGGVAMGQVNGQNSGGISTGGGARGFSTTNVQEAGIDEPDLVKTDGTRIFVMQGGSLYVVDAASHSITGRLQLGRNSGTDLLIAGDRALVVANSWEPARLMPWFGANRARISVVDVADPQAMRVVSTITLEGEYVSARMIDGIARVVVRSNASGLTFAYPRREGPVAARRAIFANRKVIARSSLDNWVPNFTVTRDGETHTGRLSSCGDLYHPHSFAGLSMVNVLTIDPADPGAHGATSLLADAETVYASERSLYVTTNRWIDPAATPSQRHDLDEKFTTEIHRFDISDPKRAIYKSSGSVSGHLLNQWSLSEKDARVRAATTDGAPWSTKTQSRVTILEEHNGALVAVGAVGGLGRGERIQAVRYIGDRAYVVTFRRIDPLFVIDLADARHPRVLGELKMNGFSSYLHPVADHYLLGVGQDADERGATKGLQLSLFDVSVPGAPVRVAHRTFTGAWSSAEHDPHAFLYWAADDLVVLPMWGCCDAKVFNGVIAFTVDPTTGISEVGRIAHPTDDSNAWDGGRQIERSLVVGEDLFTVSQHGVMASGRADLKQRAWVPWAPTFSSLRTYAGGARGNTEGEIWRALFDRPGQIVALQNEMFFADTGNRRIVYVDQMSHVRAIGDVFPAPPTGLARATDGTLYVATRCALWSISAPLGDEPKRELVAGPASAGTACPSEDTAPAIDGVGAAARFGALAHLAMARDGSVIAADQGAHAIRRITFGDNGAVVTTISGTLGAPGYADGRDARFDSPSSLIVMRDGRVAVADTRNHVVRMIATDGAVTTVAGRAGVAGDDDARLTSPTSLAYDAFSRTLYVTEAPGLRATGNRIRAIWNGRISTLSGDGRAGLIDGEPLRGRFDSPSSLAMRAGTVFIADAGNHRIRLLERTCCYFDGVFWGD